MRKTIYVLLFLLLCAGRASAQFTVVSGTVTDVSGFPYSQALMTMSLSVPVGFSGAILNGVQIAGSAGPIQLDNTGSFIVRLADNTVLQCGNSQGQIVACTPQTTWKFNITFSPGVPPPVGTGPQTCSATLTISGASQNVGSALSAACPAIVVRTGSSSSSTTGTAIDVTQAPYNVKPDGVFIQDATTTSGSGTITVPDAGVLSTAFAGMNIFGVGVGGLANCPSKTTILGVNPGAQTITVASSTVTSTQVANCFLFWFTEQTPQLLNAFNAVSAFAKCGKLILPSGILEFNQPLLPSIPAKCGTGGPGAGEGPGYKIDGQGRQVSFLIPGPDLLLSNTTLFGGNAFNPSNFSLYGLNQTCGAQNVGASNLFLLGSGSVMSHVGVSGYCNGPLTGTVNGINWTGQQDIIEDSFDDTAGTTACTGSQNGFLTDVFCGDVTGPSLSANPGIVTSLGGSYGPGTGANGNIITVNSMVSVGDIMNATVLNTCGVKATGTLTLLGSNFTNSTNANSAAICTQTGANYVLTGSTVAGGSTGGAINGSAGTVTNVGGNTITGPLSTFTGPYLQLGEVGRTTVTVNSATVGPTTVFTTAANGAGLYRVCVDMDVTAAGTAGTISATISWNNGAAQSVTTPTLSITTANNEYPNGAGGNATNPGCFTINVNASQNIQYTFTVAGATGTPATKGQVSVEAL